MAPNRKAQLLMFYIALVLLSCILFRSNATSSSFDHAKRQPGVRRLLLKSERAEEEDRLNPPPKKIKSTTTTSQSKSSPTSDQLPPPKPKLKKLNSTTLSTKLSSKNATTLLITKSKKLTNSASKATDLIKSIPHAKKSSDFISSTQPKNKTSKINSLSLSPPNSTTAPKIKKSNDPVRDTKSKTLDKQNSKITNPKPKPTQPSWIDQDEEDELVSDFRNLPSKFQQTLLPDLESISRTSKAYLTKANKEMTKNFKPLVGNKYASTTANFVSFAFIILVSLLISRIKTYFSLQKLLIFINIYLSIYFSILSLSAVVTGVEPLRFFFATSQSTYVGLQILQALCYVAYLLLLLMNLALVLSTKTGLGLKLLGLVQVLVGFAVGLHYYVAVFHRVVLHQPPKTNWKVHAVYATCFFVICWFASAERRKKEYLEEGGEEGKKN